jgi:hypothetical protein
LKSNIQFWERDSVVFQRKKVKFHHYAFEQMHFASVEFWLGLPSYTTEDDMSQIYEKKKKAFDGRKIMKCLSFVVET